MCCRRYGQDHRPAMVTKAHKPVILAHRLSTFLGIRGTPERAGLSPLGRPIQDHLQLITPPSSAHAAAPSYAAESMIEAGVSANGASPGRLPIRADPETIHRRVVQPITQLVANRSSQSRSATARSPRCLHEFDQGIATASRSAPRFAVAGVRGNGRNSSRIRGSNASTSDPVAARTYLGSPKLATAAFTVFGEIRPHGAAVDTGDRQCPGRCLRDGRTAGFHRSGRFLPTVVLSDSMGSGRVNELSTDGC
jgi:hypothetical protein